MMSNKIFPFKIKLLSDVSTIPGVFQQNRLPALDGIRAISILIVIFGHILNIKLNKPSFINERFGVEIFFVLSGFLITIIILKEKLLNKKVSLRKFYFRRILRIFPVAYFYLLSVWIIVKYVLHFDIALENLKSTAFYYSNFIPGPWYVFHYWSLSVEEQFYVLFPIILSRCTIKVYLTVCFAFLLLFPVFNILAYHDIYKQNVFRNSLFIFQYNPILIGSVFAILIFKNILNKRVLTWPWWMDLCMAITAAFFFEVQLPFALNKLLCPIFISLFIGKHIFEPKDKVGFLLNLPILKYLGIMSYSLYIVQQPFTLIVWIKSHIWLDTFSSLILMFMTAFLLHNYLEKPFLKLKETLH